MFEHSVKVPRLYKTAAQIARKSSEGVATVKQLVFERKHPNIKAIYALVVETLKRGPDLDRLFKKAKLFEKEPRFDIWLAKVLATELLWQKKRLLGDSKPIKTILAYEQIFRALDSDFNSHQTTKPQDSKKPRYVRVNTLKISTFEAINIFRDEEWILCRLPEGATYDDFLEKCKNLAPEEFIVDFHIPDLLVFPPKTEFYAHELYKNGSIFLQDKASCLPVHILNPLPGSTFLDMCAAPGMKTTHAASLMKNNGIIYAVEMDKGRFKTLNEIVEQAGATCVKTMNRDVLELSEKDCNNVEYILVDPSCSGSGIVNRLNIGCTEEKPNSERLGKLAGFQIKILRHALNHFSNSKRVVYSTCSLYPEENEDVVRQVLETCTSFKLVDARNYLKTWKNTGSQDFGQLGEYCIYSKPGDDLTHGFFVAVFERLNNGEKNQFLNAQIVFMNKKRKNNNKDDLNNRKKQKIDLKNDSVTQSSELNGESKTNQHNGKKKKKRKKAENGSSESIGEKKKKHEESDINNEPEDVTIKHDVFQSNELNAENGSIKSGGKKKKKHKESDINEESEEDGTIKHGVAKFTGFKVEYEQPTVNTETTDLTTKKKKNKVKNKNSEELENNRSNDGKTFENDLEQMNNSEVTLKEKKKKKHKKEDNAETIVKVSNENKKKKKKDKNEIKDTTEIIIIDDQDEKDVEKAEVPQKKKKKSKRKNEDSSDCILIEPNDLEQAMT